jgi:hypothetical protein
MNRRLVTALALAVVAIAAPLGGALADGGSAAGTSAAAVPAACADGGPKQRAHEAGRRQGAAMVASAWAAVERECAALAHVEEVVRDAIAHHRPPASASDVVKCRSTGFEGGAEEELTHLAAQCGQ